MNKLRKTIIGLACATPFVIPVVYKGIQHLQQDTLLKIESLLDHDCSIQTKVRVGGNVQDIILCNGQNDNLLIPGFIKGKGIATTIGQEIASSPGVGYMRENVAGQGSYYVKESVSEIICYNQSYDVSEDNQGNVTSIQFETCAGNIPTPEVIPNTCAYGKSDISISLNNGPSIHHTQNQLTCPGITTSQKL